MSDTQKAVQTLRRFWTGNYWNGVSRADAEEIENAFLTLEGKPIPETPKANPKCIHCQGAGEVTLGGRLIFPCPCRA